MEKKELLIIADYSDESLLTLEELSRVCGIPVELIYDLIAYDIVRPSGGVSEQWIFDLVQLQRAKVAMRLQNDLEVNLAGAALVLDLLEELEKWRARAELLEKHGMK